MLIVVTHSPTLAATFHRQLQMRDGQLQQQGHDLSPLRGSDLRT
jgi:ABC-type lipoprotein export system ATPase subunit